MVIWGPLAPSRLARRNLRPEMQTSPQSPSSLYLFIYIYLFIYLGADSLVSLSISSQDFWEHLTGADALLRPLLRVLSHMRTGRFVCFTRVYLCCFYCIDWVHFFFPAFHYSFIVYQLWAYITHIVFCKNSTPLHCVLIGLGILVAKCGDRLGLSWGCSWGHCSCPLAGSTPSGCSAGPVGCGQEHSVFFGCLCGSYCL